MPFLVSEHDYKTGTDRPMAVWATEQQAQRYIMVLMEEGDDDADLRYEHLSTKAAAAVDVPGNRWRVPTPA